MKPTEKILALATGIFAIGLVLAVAFFVFVEFRYLAYGATGNATITDVTREFARFANNETEGTKPIYRYRCSYRFTANGETLFHEMTTETHGYAIGDSLAVQYLLGTPNQHRVLTANVQMFRYLSIAFLLAFAGLAVAVSARALFVSPAKTQAEPSDG